MLKSRHVLKLRASELGRCSRLEGAAEKQLGRKKRGELHVEAGTRGRHVMTVMCGLVKLLLSINRRDISTARVPISEARNVRSEGTVREAGVAVGRLRRVTESTCRVGGTSGNATGCREVLHPEKMRRDKAVP